MGGDLSGKNLIKQICNMKCLVPHFSFGSSNSLFFNYRSILEFRASIATEFCLHP